MVSITFGGPDLRTVYIGSLGGTALPTFRSSVAGAPLPHWSA
jgi:gluconolactonase